MRLKRLLLSAIVVLSASVGAGALAAEEVRLQMDFLYGGIKIADTTDTLTLSDDGQSYELVSEAKAVGLAKILHGDVYLKSVGAVDDTHGLRMSAYYEQRGKRAQKNAALEGDQLRLQKGEETRTEAVTAPVFDYLTAAYRSYIIGAPTGGELLITNGWRLKKYHYQLGETETVETGMGAIEAVPLIRNSERGVRKVWLAPSLGYLPIRFYIDDKGHIFDAVLRQASVNL